MTQPNQSPEREREAQPRPDQGQQWDPNKQGGSPNPGREGSPGNEPSRQNPGERGMPDNHDR